MLQGKVALITGAGQGIGQGIALALAREGVDLILSGRTLEKLTHTAQLVAERGARALPIACNVKSPTISRPPLIWRCAILTALTSSSIMRRKCRLAR